jgi:hypothetical protein
VRDYNERQDKGGGRGGGGGSSYFAPTKNYSPTIVQMPPEMVPVVSTTPSSSVQPPLSHQKVTESCLLL